MTTDDIQYVVDEKGHRTAVIVPIGEYEELIEDLHDLASLQSEDKSPSFLLED